MLRFAVAAWLAVLTLGQQAAAEVRGLYTVEPRAFGYFLGDPLTRIVEIETGPEDDIVTASLPRTGPTSYWLELRAIERATEQRGDGRLHRLVLTYQSFYAAIDPRKVTIPATEITIRGPGGSETATIPPFDFVMSPLREIFPEKSSGEDEKAQTTLRPDAEPVQRRSGAFRTGALVAAGLSALLLALLARDLAWWPFHRRPARPFSRAAREVSGALSEGGSDGYRTALLALHRAFDTAAGRRLLAADVDRFLGTHPEHGDVRTEVERFFSASRSVFFGDAVREGEIGMPPTELRALAATLARQERAAR